MLREHRGGPDAASVTEEHARRVGSSPGYRPGPPDLAAGSRVVLTLLA